MTGISHNRNNTDNTDPSTQIRVVYAACAWSFIFAAMSFYWVAGGTIGLNTLGEFARNPDAELITITWITGILKVLAGLLALALVQRWGRRFPRWTLRFGAWGLGLFFSLYGVANAIDHLLMATGIRNIPGLLGSTGVVYWHLLFWDPWWVIGGILFLLAARQFSRRQAA